MDALKKSQFVRDCEKREKKKKDASPNEGVEGGSTSVRGRAVRKKREGN